MQDSELWFLENIDATGIFCPKKMGMNMDKMGHPKFKKGSYIYMQDDKSDALYLIVGGKVKIGTSGEGNKEIIKAILGKGEIFGELSVFGEGSRRDFALAMEETELCIIDKSQMNELIKGHSSLSLFLLKIVGSRQLEMEKRLESLVFKDSKTRIMEFIVNLVGKKGERVGYEWVVRNFMTHQEIANLTATSRQTVTTLLNELRNENCITFNRKRLLVRDLDKIKTFI